MRLKASTLRRKLFIAVLVLMTLLPLVVYVYLRERGRSLAAERLAEHVERSVTRVLQMKDKLEPILEKSGAGSEAVRGEMERLVLNDDSIAYMQLADKGARVVSSTRHAPSRVWAPVRVLPPGSPEIAAPKVAGQRGSPGDPFAPEFVVDLRLSKQERGYLLVGMSAETLDKQLHEFQDPVRWASLHIAIICVAMLAGFSAYIVYLHDRARALHAQLQEESRLAYIGTLAAGIAHEVRNPLSSVKMNVQMMEHRLKELPDQEQAEYFLTKVERIKGEVDRLEESVSHFLAYARPRPLRPERTRLSDVVDNVIELLQPQCQSRGVQLVRRYARDLPVIQADPRQLIQAVQNLVLNAMQAIERNGTITVSTSATEGGAAITVADTGPGIPEDIQEKIFEVFFTTREGGTGLGLNIVSRIVEEHRGKLTLQSKPGEGAAFRIELPAAGDEAKAQEAT